MGMKLDWRKAALVAGRDLKDAAGDLRLALAMGGLALAVPIASAGGIRALAYFGGGVSTVVERLTVVGAFFVVFLPASFSLVLALESFVGERERATLEVLLSTPLREAEIYAGKVASVMAVSLTLCYGALAIYCLVVFPGLGYFPLGILVSLAVSTICQVAAMVAGAVIVSANARTMRAANVMASFIILPMSVALQLEAALILLGRAILLWGFAALMALGALILLRMGMAGFSREALLAREAGGGRPLRRLVSAYRSAFTARPSLLHALLRCRVPIAIAAFSFVAGCGSGYFAAAARGVPEQLVKPALAAMLQGSNTAPGGRAGQAFLYFGHNLTALLLAAVLAPITLGLAGAALTYLPGFLLGFAAGLSSWSLAVVGILPSGLVEIPVALIAGGFLIQTGATVIHMDPEGGWARRVITAQADYLRVLAWLLPALALAAILEAYL